MSYTCKRKRIHIDSHACNINVTKLEEEAGRRISNSIRKMVFIIRLKVWLSYICSGLFVAHIWRLYYPRLKMTKWELSNRSNCTSSPSRRWSQQGNKLWATKKPTRIGDSSTRPLFGLRSKFSLRFLSRSLSYPFSTFLLASLPSYVRLDSAIVSIYVSRLLTISFPLDWPIGSPDQKYCTLGIRSNAAYRQYIRRDSTVRSTEELRCWWL